MAKTPNLDVLRVQMSPIFGKCRLAFFVAFRARKVIFMAFSIFPKKVQICEFSAKLVQKKLSFFAFKAEIAVKGPWVFKLTKNYGGIQWSKMATSSSNGLQIKRFKLFGTVKVLRTTISRGQPGEALGRLAPSTTCLTGSLDLPQKRSIWIRTQELVFCFL